jgi:hypothetical protein
MRYKKKKYTGKGRKEKEWKKERGERREGGE